MSVEEQSEKYLFAEMPVPRAVTTLAIPTIISQVVTMIYNLADTFFIGQLGDPGMVAAVSLVSPWFNLLTALGNLFGLGGSSLISRMLGAKDHRDVKFVASFSIWGGAAATLVFSLGTYLFRRPLLEFLGASQATYGYAQDYLFWVVVLGGVPTMVSLALGHLLRSEGHARPASAGMMFGGILNVVLDPVLIFLFHLDVAGAAIATALSNAASVVFFVVVYLGLGDKTSVSLHPKYFTFRFVRPIFSVGLASALATALGNASNMVMVHLASAYGAPADEKEMAKLLEKAVDMGYTFFDTAECYTGVRPDGTTAYNEELVGAALKPYRDKVVIATKCGVRHLGDRLEVDCSPQAIRKAVEGSLRRLQTDHIDLYYQHRMDPNVEPEVVADTMAQLMKEGKITHWGISEASEDYLRRAHAVCPVTAIQNRLSMMYQDYEALFPTLEELNVGFVAFSPLANGLLSARYLDTSQFEHSAADYRSTMPQFSQEGVAQNRDLLALLEDTAREKNATPAQISLAWMLAKKPYIVPIPGSRKEGRIRENLGAAEVTLTAEEVDQLDKALEHMAMSQVFGGHRVQ